jgi:hypothetical protein
MNQHEKAKAWRIRNGYQKAALSKLTGFSRTSIDEFETGFYRKDGRPIGERAMRRYRLICAAISHGNADWDWE